MEVKDIPDVQLKELIETIHRDGVDKGREESELLLKQTHEKADKILSEAKSQAETILNNAKRETERLEHSGKESLKQASRDLLLRVRKQLEALFTEILREKTETALNEKEFSQAILALISNWNPETHGDIEVLLPKEKASAITQTLMKSLGEKISKGIEIKASEDLSQGFRIYEKDSHAFYDFSAESIAENLSVYLNPIMSKIVQESLQQDV